ncbi:MAG TPA: CCA tRNA nucleotidyltransferase [Clostridiales bacterium]|nr:CCA tRNA nucleotidyltransferase [Clostridiales bacterium]
MAVIALPKYVTKVMKGLESAGFGAYLVGGCVRDMIMGKRPHDWDVCTDALPHEVMALFPKARPTGLKHGTVTVSLGEGHVEVTTFRTDGEYADHRRPDTVSFISDINEDLRRRDFTVNAIALSLSGEVIDPFDGRKDIADRIIRCVGNPRERFQEDALRMFRALRFSACLGFAVHEATYSAIFEMSHLAAFLAAERIREELEKTLLSPNPHILGQVIEAGLMDSYLAGSGGAVPELKGFGRLPKNNEQRWAAFCAILERGGLISSSEAFLRQLRLSGSEIRNCGEGASLALNNPPADSLGWKRLLADKGVEIAMCTAAAADVLYSSGSLNVLREVLNSGECFSLKQLAVTGDDLLALGFSGIELGETLRLLLDYVIRFPEENERERLLNLATGMERSHIY